ncbi:MAG: hypothetical protein GWN71_04285, partial [Gammaproteobacteria bacterium]|nr:protein BatD [Gemmatimonadota bacterium]NIU72816.1 hypothetical protein [Gammaproteobacteria bacterium]NIX18995.1 hypothetical protein [Actinomycetota bacterium]
MNGITLIALALAAQATAGGEVAVEARVAADTVTVGDRFTLTITVSGLSDGQVDFPILPDSGLITAVSGPELVEGRRPGAWSARYALAAWDTGTVDLPGARVEISSGDDRS